MSKILLAILILPLLFLSPSLAQEKGPTSTPLARIFANYRQQINNAGSYNGFDVTRVYLGYKFKFDNKISAKIMLDIGKPLSTPDVSSKRYTYVKNALIQYKVTEGLTLSGGITEVKGCTVPNIYWDRKYIRPPFLLEHKFMNSADLGFVVDYKVSDFLAFDLGVFNGEGYTKIEEDGVLQYAAGLTLIPLDGFTIRFYGDFYNDFSFSKNTYSAFSGFKNKSFMLGFEYAYQTDSDMIDMHNMYAFSTIASVNITPKLDLFGRYDNKKSVIPDGETDPWNLSKDGSMLISGIQYSYTKYIRLSLNYQGWTPADNSEVRWDYIQLNALFRF